MNNKMRNVIQAARQCQVRHFHACLNVNGTSVLWRGGQWRKLQPLDMRLNAHLRHTSMSPQRHSIRNFKTSCIWADKPKPSIWRSSTTDVAAARNPFRGSRSDLARRNTPPADRRVCETRKTGDNQNKCAVKPEDKKEPSFLSQAFGAVLDFLSFGGVPFW